MPSTPNSKSDEWWSRLKESELLYVEAFRDSLRSAVENQNAAPTVDFAGFIYRGVAIKNSRTQLMAASDAVLKKNNLDPDIAAKLQSTLIEYYLEFFGRSTTINNLVLETASKQNIIFRDNGTSEHVYCLDLSGSGPSSIVSEDLFTTITISNNICKLLGRGEDWMKEVQNIIRQIVMITDGEHNDDVRHLYLKIQDIFRSNSDLSVEAASNLAITQETDFTLDFLNFVSPRGSKLLIDRIGDLKLWLNAIQALFIFTEVFGQYWATVPYKPPFYDELDRVGIDAPLSGFTFLSSSSLPTEASAIADTVVSSTMKKNPVLTRSVDSEIKALHQSVHNNRIKKIKGSSPSTYSKKDIDRIYVFNDILLLAERLSGAIHEGKKLQFKLLCSPEHSLLQLHSKSDSRSWAIKTLWQLGQTDFPINQFHDNIASSSDRADPLHRVNLLAAAIENNALLLQEPDLALHFSPYYNVVHPERIVKIDPYDARLSKRYLSEFTEGGKSMLAVDISWSGASVYMNGTDIIRYDKSGVWSWVSDETAIGEGAMASRLQELLPRGTIDSGEAGKIISRCEYLEKVAIELARRNYGALILIHVNKLGELVHRDNMAPAWGTYEDSLTRLTKYKNIDYVEPRIFATIAGLDGACIVNIKKGSYRAKQQVFASLDDDKVFDQSESGISIGADLALAWNEASGGGGSIKTEGIESIYTFGTRHLTALRLTLADPDVLALTVSEDGPIRLWKGGVPLYQFLA